MFKSLVNPVKKLLGSWDSPAALSDSGFDVVNSRSDGKRRTARIERKNEDEMLPASLRLKALALTRAGMRNAPQVRAIVQQLRVLTIGLQGGKLTFTTDDDAWNVEAQTFFGEWAKSIDYIDGTGLNETLKLIVTALAAEGGDYAAVFDDGCLSGGTGSGKVRFFESDNIANIDPTVFKKRFPGHTQSQGLIYSPAGRWVGIVLSGKTRGKTVFGADEAFTLTRDPDASPFESSWYYGKRKWRLLQGRGISPQTVAIAALLDMYEIVSSEVQCGKLNSKIFAQVVDSLGINDGTDGNEDMPEGTTDAAVPAGEGEEVPEETAGDEATLDITEFEALSGAHTLNMPYGHKMDLLDTKRPNNNMIQFVEWLNGGAAAVHGLGRVYSSLKAETSYTAFRGEQTISWSSVEEGQKEIERGPLDWKGVRAIRWGITTGKLSQGPEGWEKNMSWSWPQMKEVNEVDAQNAVGSKLRNFMSTYRQLLGPNWKELLTQVSTEIKWFTDNKMIHPSQQTVSGQVVGIDGPKDNTKKGSDKET